MARGGDYSGDDARAGPPDGAETKGFVPDLCEARAVLTVLIVAQLLAVTLSLAPGYPPGEFWSRLGITSLFVLWIALLSAALLCTCRPYLARLPPWAAGLAAFVLLQLLVLVISVGGALVTRAAPALAVGDAAAFASLWRNLVIGGIVNAVFLRYLYLQHSVRQRLVAESQARLQALQSRIRPHFLFNSLNTILSLIRNDPAAAEQATESLADLFRASLREAGPLTTLREELRLCHSYLEIERLRLGDRLRVAWDIDALPPTLAVPPLVLQPLLENAIYHGIERVRDPGAIRVTGRLAQDRAQIVLVNPLPATTGADSAGHRIAIDNIRARLQAHFSSRAALVMEPLEDSFRVTLTLPLTAAAP